MKIKEKILAIEKKTAQVYLCFKAKETPMYAKIMAFITIAYALSPIDLIPDFIPLLGYLDDFVIIPFLAWLTIKLIPKDIWNKYSEEASDLWENGKPKRWYFAIPIIIIWIIIICLVAYLIWKSYARK